MASDGNGKAPVNASIGAVAQRNLDDNQAELQRIAARLCEIVPVGASVTLVIQVQSALTDAGGKRRVEANEAIVVSRPAVMLGKQYVVVAGQGHGS